MSVAKVEKSDWYVWEVDLAERKNRGDKYRGEEEDQGGEGSDFVVISKSRGSRGSEDHTLKAGQKKVNGACTRSASGKNWRFAL